MRLKSYSGKDEMIEEEPEKEDKRLCTKKRRSGGRCGARGRLCGE